MFTKGAKLASKHLKTQVSAAIVGSQTLIRSRTIKLGSALSKRSVAQSAVRPIGGGAIGVSVAFSSESSDDLNHKSSGKLSTIVAACGFAKTGRPRYGVASMIPSSDQHANTNDQPVLGQVGQAGEDAFFVSEDGVIFGVADGVGGWSSVKGADSAAYSRNLMRYAMEACHSKDMSMVKPVDVLQFSFDKISREHRIIGSSTACIAAFDPQSGMLHYANLGDSGLMLVRSALLNDVEESESRKLKNEIPASPKTPSIIRAKECQHTFNCPYQLGSSSSDRPGDSCQESLQVNNGDLLVVGTDGFWDNLNDQEVLAILRKNAKAPHTFESLNNLARQLALEAYEAASSSTRPTPFAQACKEAGKRFFGGKMDDITVIVAQFVSDTTHSTPPSSHNSGTSSPASDSSLSPRGSAAVHPAEERFRPSKM